MFHLAHVEIRQKCESVDFGEKFKKEFSDSGAKKVLLSITLVADVGTVPSELVGSFNLIFYSSTEDAVYKALGG